MDRRSFLIGSAAGLIGGISAIRDGWADNQPLIHTKVGYDGYSMTTAPMYYASKTGLFNKYGLDVTLIYVQGGSTLSQAGVAGSIDMAQNGYTPAAAAAIEGGNLVFIGGISNTLPFQLVVKPGIKSAQDLRGKKVAISKFGSSSDIAADFALSHLGLTRQDVTILQLGGEGTRTAAMLSGQIDGSIEQYPRTADLEEKGYKTLVDLTDLDASYPNTAYVTTRPFLKNHRDTVKKFLMAITNGIYDYKHNPQKAMQFTAEFLNVQQGDALKKTYDLYNKKVFPDIPWPSMKGIGLVIAQLAKTDPRAASVKPEQITDMTPLQELQNEGFFAKFK